MSGSETIVVLLTPPGRGAVASILVEGVQATEHASRLFFPASGRSLDKHSLNKIIFGRWGSADGEEVVVCRRGTACIEVHGHGGAAAPAAILASLVEAGCREVDWQTHLAKGSYSQIQVEARVALAKARTERTAAILLGQYQGALDRAIQQTIKLIEGDQIDQASDRLRELLGWTVLGSHLIEPWKVAIAGKPNVGKSSLMNALLGYERTIVFDQPGTTRDVVTASTALDGWPVEFSDTAGLRVATSEIEAEGVARARSTQATADAVVLVFDASGPWGEEQQELLASQPGAIVVHNKIDLVDKPSPLPTPGLATSALTGQGLSELITAIVHSLVPATPPTDAAIPFTRRQVDLLQAALDQLAVSAPDRAVSLLKSL